MILYDIVVDFVFGLVATVVVVEVVVVETLAGVSSYRVRSSPTVSALVVVVPPLQWVHSARMDVAMEVW